MKIYTKTGDNGTTSLIGGKRVFKSDLRIECYGTIDELISFIALLKEQDNISNNIDLLTIEDILMLCATRLACYNEENLKKYEEITLDNYQFLEFKIDQMTSKLDKLNNFLLPGGNKINALCHVCRTITRRCERLLIKLIQSDEYVDDNIIIFINRLSDYFFTLARYYSKILNTKEIIWKK